LEAADDFSIRFSGRTLRFDFFHSGTSAEEWFSPDEFRLEGDWAGSKTQLLDSSGLGKYWFEIVDRETQTVLYSRGFASIFGEWETTGEARSGLHRTYHESLRFPEPKRAFLVRISKRTEKGGFAEVFNWPCDPVQADVKRAPLASYGSVRNLFQHGDPASKVDLLILGEGYTAAEGDKFDRDVDRLAGVLFDTEPFRSRRSDFNVRALNATSVSSGISNPRGGKWLLSTLGLSFNAFGTDRYVLTFRNRELREVAAQAPYDYLVILFNERKYGGGGIFNLWATCASDTKPAPYVFVHEFGHSFGGLADEYYSSQVAYEEFVAPGVEPWEPNVTALLDPKELKWRGLISAGTPVPTPWDQAGFDKVSAGFDRRRSELARSGAPDAEVETLFDDLKAALVPFLRNEPYWGKVGAFEGAAYRSKGLYRPALDCIMFSRNPAEFCPVCRRALESRIDLEVRP